MGLCQLRKCLLCLISAWKLADYRFIIASYRLHISRNIIDNTIQSEDDGHLDQQRQTAACHRCTVFLIYCLNLSLHHHRGLLIIFFSLILLLDRCDLRLHNGH